MEKDVCDTDWNIDPKSTEWTGLQEESDTLEVIFGVETSNLARSMA